MEAAQRCSALPCHSVPPNSALLTLIYLPALLALQAQNKTAATTPVKADFKGTLESKGFKLAAALFDIANMTAALNKPAAFYTVLV